MEASGDGEGVGFLVVGVLVGEAVLLATGDVLALPALIGVAVLLDTGVTSWRWIRAIIAVLRG